MAEPVRPGSRRAQAPGIGLALLAALLFGVSTPSAHWLLGSVPPVLLSALLYLGSGLGLTLTWQVARLARHDPPSREAVGTGTGAGASARWSLAGAILCGGVLAPVAMLAGLQSTPASSAALLLNLEGVLTALLAWCVFGEGVDTGIALGMLCVVLGSLLLAWPAPGTGASFALDSLRGPALIGLACLGWAVDNNLTRSAAHLDARLIARWKGLVAGAVNLLLAGVLAGGATALLAQLQAARTVLALALLTGWLGYGVSLVAYVRAQALLGAARTGAWFGLAPFAGVLAALLVLHEPAPHLLWPATALIAAGLWLHVRERHAHWHRHPAQTHHHAHRHDDHHQHRHDFPWDGREPHAHVHAHAEDLHRHVHFPDLHHRHRHGHPPTAVAPDDSLLPAALIASYRDHTTYQVRDPLYPALALDLRIGQPAPDLARLLQGLQGALFITACNPLGQPLAPADNAVRQAALRRMFDDAGLQVREGIGQGDDPGWPGEASLLVLDVARTDALRLGTFWEQNAVVWCDAAGVPELLLLR